MRFPLAVMFALRPAFFALVALSASSALFAAESAKTESPFLPPAGAPAPAAKEATNYSFAGMTVLNGETLLSITREADKRSTWIPVGKTVGDITAVGYDPKKDEAIIRVDGRELTLPIRKSVVVAAPVNRPPVNATVLPAPSAATAPAAEPEPIKMPPLNQQEEREMEARMFVSDLLEIGQQQRRAYEAAQREAAAKAAAESRAKAAQK